jgi:flagellar hook-basal body complex protein FliE
MAVNSLSVLNAYRNQLKMQQGIEQQATGNNPESMQASFSNLVKNAAEQAVDSQYQSEGLQMQSLTGKVELSNLVTAVANADIALQTVVAVRDRVINAYQDIIKMTI